MARPTQGKRFSAKQNFEALSSRDVNLIIGANADDLDENLNDHSNKDTNI
jgi:hypothetical protein